MVFHVGCKSLHSLINTWQYGSSQITPSLLFIVTLSLSSPLLLSSLPIYSLPSSRHFSSSSSLLREMRNEERKVWAFEGLSLFSQPRRRLCLCRRLSDLLSTLFAILPRDKQGGHQGYRNLHRGEPLKES